MGELANLFSIVDLPDEGLPTRPIKGSRGIARVYNETNPIEVRRAIK